MPYNINRYNGTLATVVEDGTVDNTLDIKLIGRNYAGYGEVQNENMVHMLEHFASPTEPPKRIPGQVWYDSGNKKLKFFDGTKFKTNGTAEISITQPSGLSQGDFWFNPETNQLYAWTGSNFILVGPQAVENAGTTELKSVSVEDITGTTYPIVKAIVNSITIYIISANEFILPDNVILGFKLIKQGITLINTMTVPSSDPLYGITTTQHRFWGTASSSLGLVQNNKLITAADLVKSQNPEFTGKVGYDDEGFELGNQDSLQVYIDSDGNACFRSIKSNGIINFYTKIATGGSDDDRAPMKLQGNDILPGITEVSNLGRSDKKFANVYAVDFRGSLKGTADQANKLNVGGTYLEAALAATANTIAVRDNEGAITSTTFKGTATLVDNVKGGVGGALVYQTDVNKTGFINKGSNNTVLSINNTGGYTWLSIDDIASSGQADTVNISTTIEESIQYPTFVETSSGYSTVKIDPTGLTYNSSTKTLTTEYFDGEASSASYADLAEKYLADSVYEVGTVMVVGGSKEITKSKYGDRAIGVVSGSPAYLMNKDLINGTVVALKGRVPVKMIGKVQKGDKIIATDDGCAMAGKPMTKIYLDSFNFFAIALESSDDPEIKLIECVIL